MKNIISIFCVATLLVSCDRYLDIAPKGQVIPTSVEDYDQLLNGGSTHSLNNENLLALTADDFKFKSSGTVDPDNPDDQNFQLYSFGPYRLANPGTPEPAWNAGYGNIYIFNKVINELPNATSSAGYGEADKKRIQAEAHFGRALDYFYLVNTFAKHYSKDNASSPGVPLVFKADVTQTSGPRSTVEEVYTQIIKDLETSLTNLPDKSVNNTRPNKGSGNALLARVYLYKGEYDKALSYASKAIQIRGTIADYTSAADPTSNVPVSPSQTMPEIYKSDQYSFRFFGASIGYGSTLTDDFKSNMDLKKDTRYSKIYAIYPDYGEYRAAFISVNQMCSVAEMYVTRAECNARLGNAGAAINDLNQLRNKRIIGNIALTQADFPTQQSLIKFCLEERRREMYLTASRLFDIKRMNLEPAFAKTIVHTYQNVNYAAEPNSNKLVLPIPAQVMRFNPNWPQN